MSCEKVRVRLDAANERIRELEAESAYNAEQVVLLAKRPIPDIEHFVESNRQWAAMYVKEKARAEKAERERDEQRSYYEERTKMWEEQKARVAELAPEMWPFFVEMTRKFRLHIPDRGDSWKRTNWDILHALNEEYKEAVSPNALPDEWADVANFCFFKWWHSFYHEAREREEC